MTIAVTCTAPASPFIETDRLILKRPDRSHAERIAQLCDDLTIAENTALIPHPYALSDANEWLDLIDARPSADLVFGIYLNIPDPVLIGAVSLQRDAQNRDPKLGYWLGAAYRGHGFSTEAARSVIRHGFLAHDFTAVSVSCRITNAASRRVIEKCGFTYAGLGRAHLRSLDREEPMDLFRLTREQWQRRRRR